MSSAQIKNASHLTDTQRQGICIISLPRKQKTEY
jgi:hypothetical protein